MAKCSLYTCAGENLSRQLKECSAKVYEGIIGDVIGESLHPGGVDVAAKVAEVAKINNASTVLDLASGKGASVRFMAENFGCNVIGMDLSSRLIKTFKRNSVKSFLGETAFVVGDGEFMPYVDSCFDVVMCECAFNLFPDKKGVLSEISRVLKDGGFLLTDIVLRRSLPEDLKTELTFALCIAGAETLGGSMNCLNRQVL